MQQRDGAGAVLSYNAIVLYMFQISSLPSPFLCAFEVNHGA